MASRSLKYLQSKLGNPSTDGFVPSFNTNGTIDWIDSSTTPPPTGASNFPKISGNNYGDEETELTLTITNYSPANVYNITIAGGSFTRTGNTIVWTLPFVAADSPKRMRIYVTEPSLTPSLLDYYVQIYSLSGTSDGVIDYVNTDMNQFMTFDNTSLISNEIVCGNSRDLEVINNVIYLSPSVGLNDNVSVDGKLYNISNTAILPATNARITDKYTRTNLIFSSENTNAQYQARTAFDGVESVDSRWLLSSSTLKSGYIGLGFADNISVGSLKITSYFTTGTPKDWNYETSKDGINWDIRETFTGGQLVDGVVLNLAESYVSKWHRINIFSTTGDYTINIMELYLYEGKYSVVSATIPSLPLINTKASYTKGTATTSIVSQGATETDFKLFTNIESTIKYPNLGSGLAGKFIQTSDLYVGETIKVISASNPSGLDIVLGNSNITSTSACILPSTLSANVLEGSYSDGVTYTATGVYTDAIWAAPQNLADRNLSNAWVSATTAPDSITYDFQIEVNIEGFEIAPGAYPSNWITFQIEGSNDNTNWTGLNVNEPLASLVSSTFHLYTCPGTEIYRYVKLTMLSGQNARAYNALGYFEINAKQKSIDVTSSITEDILAVYKHDAKIGFYLSDGLNKKTSISNTILSYDNIEIVLKETYDDFSSPNGFRDIQANIDMKQKDTKLVELKASIIKL